MERAELSQALRAWRSRGTVTGSKEPVLISDPDPTRFMAALADAVAGEADVFLGDPSWGEGETAQLSTLLKSRDGQPAAKLSQGWLMIPTGGTGGRLKFARHDSATVAAAVRGFVRHFSLGRVNAVGLLPLHHVSGLMSWLRCALTGGQYLHCDWKEIEAGNLPGLPDQPDGWVLSLVPTQLERLLRNAAAVAWLRGFRIIFVGGGPAWPALLERAAAEQLSLSTGYGMTETAAMVTALRPEEFRAGARSSGRPLPHAQVGLTAEGLIRIEGSSLFRGYFPAWRQEAGFVTADLGRFDAHGHLQVSGRNDAVVITGGEKVNPGEVESVLRDTGAFADVVVLGVPDPEWGESVVAAYPAGAAPDLRFVATAVERLLSPPKRPKRYVALAAWPVNTQGKVNRAEVARLVTATRDERSKQAGS